MITFHEIYEKYSRDVYRYAFWLAGSAEDADDITSETFARAWAGREEIRTETVKAYLFAVARNLYLKRWRHIKRETDLSANQIDTKPVPERIVESKLEMHRVMSVIQSFPELDRAADLCRSAGSSSEPRPG